MKKLLIIIVSLFITVAFTGFLKFNYFDIPYLGDPITYQTEHGGFIAVSNRVDGSIQLELPNELGVILTQVKSDSGEKYKNKSKSLVFWRKGDTFVVVKDNVTIYNGKYSF